MKTEYCFICKEEIDVSQHYAMKWHLKNEHGISKKEDYLESHVYVGDYLTCACGCGEGVSKLKYFPYKREFISGHNSMGENNPMHGKEHNDSSKKKMSNSAKKRMELQIEENGHLPYHSPESLKKRGEKQTQRYIDYVENRCNITIVNTKRRNGIGYYNIKCNECNHEFEKFHADVILCPKCNPYVKSKYENDIYDWMCDEFPDITVKRNDRTVLGGLELDFYIESHKLAIEFNGLYYHTELVGGKDRNYHLKKTELCIEKGIHLLQIFEDEWVDNEPLVKNKIRYALGKFNKPRIYARQCKIDLVSYTTASEFLNKNHIQGSDISSIRLGLYYKGDLVAIMTYSVPNAARGHKNIKEKTYELSRFASSNDYLVVGGAGKLFAYFIREHNPDKIITYADRRWSSPTKNLYESIGFKLTLNVTAGYWYFSRGNIKRFHRFAFTKKKTVEMGGDPNKTEWENMQEMGFDRIWDCGNYRYEWIKTNDQSLH